MDKDKAELAGGFIKAALKAKKLLQIYPANNIIYRNAVDETYSAAEECLVSYGDLVFVIKPSAIMVESDQIYQASGKTDNFSLVFFKEGIREIIFREGLTRNELEDFLRITGIDYDRNESGDDLVSAFWESSFEHIKLTIDEVAFLEGDGIGGIEGESEEGVEHVPGVGSLFHGDEESGKGMQTQQAADEAFLPVYQEESKLLRAYRDSVDKEDHVPVASEDLTTEERVLMVGEMQKPISEKSCQLAEILIAMLASSRDSAESDAVSKSIRDLIIYSLRGNDLGPSRITLRGIREIQEGLVKKPDTAEIAEHAGRMISFFGSKEVLDYIGRMMDSTKDVNEDDLLDLAGHLGSGALEPLMYLLENLQSISSRRIVNNVLIRIGRENIDALLSHLKDPTWYVVRNIIYILRNIGDPTVLDNILRMSIHEHPRVRLEVVKALNDFRSVKALEALKKFFDDRDSTVRMSAITVLGTVAKEHSGARLFARDAIFSKIREKGFEERDFKERKYFYEALAPVHDKEVDAYMLDTLKKRSLFGGKRSVEAKACAAHYLGLAGSSDARPILEKMAGSSDPLLREHASAALQRMRHE